MANIEILNEDDYIEFLVVTTEPANVSDYPILRSLRLVTFSKRGSQSDYPLIRYVIWHEREAALPRDVVETAILTKSLPEYQALGDRSGKKMDFLLDRIPRLN
jgi:hypothetical protein